LLQTKQINYQDIAHNHIQNRRAKTPVPCSQGGTLHDYVPFYFAPCSPMLYAIYKGNVEGYSEGQNPVIYLVSEAEAIEAYGLSFAFTDGHAVMAYAEFSDDLNDLDFIDWELMKSKYWFDKQDDPNRKFRRQAEFLVYQFFPWELITKIGVISHNYKTLTEELLRNIKNLPCPPVEVSRNWYY
jgi:hypothetical protein